MGPGIGFRDHRQCTQRSAPHARWRYHGRLCTARAEPSTDTSGKCVRISACLLNAAAAYSGAADEERNADRIAVQDALLSKLSENARRWPAMSKSSNSLEISQSLQSHRLVTGNLDRIGGMARGPFGRDARCRPAASAC